MLSTALTLSLTLLQNPAPEEGWQTLASRVVKRTLPNGLRILLLPRGEAPVLSFHTYVDVGSSDERPGITGVAHLFEHMAFKGSPRIGTKDWEKEKAALENEERSFLAWREAVEKGDAKGAAAREAAFRESEKEVARWIAAEEFSTAIETAGGVGLNATTNSDATQYFYSLPANKLELWAWLESERFAHPVLREFYKERDVVQEERRMRTESSPQGQLFEAFLATAFLAHPYGSPTVGHMSDLKSISRSEAERFYRERYSPAGTAIAVVGAVDPEAALPMLEKYFGRIPAGPAPRRVPTAEPPQKGERRVEVETRANPSLMMGFHRPDGNHPDDAALSALADILGGGRYSRLYARLVKQDQVATQASTFAAFPGSKYACLFSISAIPSAGRTTEECEKAIEEEIGRLTESGPTPEEIEGVKRRTLARFIDGLDSNSGLARNLCRFEALKGDFAALFREPERIQGVSADDVRRAARSYLKKSNRTVAVLAQKEGAGASR